MKRHHIPRISCLIAVAATCFLYAGSDTPSVETWRLQQIGVHNAGRLRAPVGCGGFADGYNFVGPAIDPETGEPLLIGLYVDGVDHLYLDWIALWVGGIDGDDTLVSTPFGYRNIHCDQELWPSDPERGGVYRTGDFADDELVAVYTDTVTDPVYVGISNPFNDTTHIPLGIKVTQTSRSWDDSLYDDFVILTCGIENIGQRNITGGWIGLEIDPAIYTDTGLSSMYGIYDDVVGCLDTVLQDGDPAGGSLIPYGFDADGDPGDNGAWTWSSNTGVIAVRLLNTSIENCQENFNWWFLRYYAEDEFAPRRVGTPEDPFRTFAGGFPGTPHREEDKYYLMAHPEVDYNQLEMGIHDSTDGWIPATCSLFSIYHEPRILYSFGPFDLPPGDSVSFVLAVAVGDDIHTDPDGFASYFNPAHPDIFQDMLDFSRLLDVFRRADSVYRSGFMLPHPGPPAGLRITDYDDSYVTLIWLSSARPGVQGYFVNVKDTVFSDTWRHAFTHSITDTTWTFSVTNPSHAYFFAVSLVDSVGRESGVSLPISLIPAVPHPPRDLAIELDGVIPTLSWSPPDDTSLCVYLIYRAAWNGPFMLYDSASALQYRDYEAESGIRYGYMVSAKTMLGLESEQIGPVTALPMVLDAGIMFYDMNFDNAPHIDPYHRRYVDRLISSIQVFVGVDYHDIEGGELPLKEMSHYSVLICDAEMRGGKFPNLGLDSLYLFLSRGGKALFIVPNASVYDLSVGEPAVHRYGPGDFFYDCLGLDSAVSNGIILGTEGLLGDLLGCQPVSAGYPVLEADPAKLAAAPVPVEGGIPLAGCLYPRAGVDILYRYQSLNPGSLLHDQVNGIARADDTSGVVLFNFPLSLMREPENIAALRRALTYLGVDLSCGDINDNGRFEIGDPVALINYLFRDGPPPQDTTRANVNCDSLVDLEDVLVMINVMFRGADKLKCCPRQY